MMKVLCWKPPSFGLFNSPGGICILGDQPQNAFWCIFFDCTLFSGLGGDSKKTPILRRVGEGLNTERKLLMLPPVGLILDLALGLFELVFWVNESIRFPANHGGAWANPLTACPLHPFPGTPLAGGKHKFSGLRVLAGSPHATFFTSPFFGALQE